MLYITVMNLLTGMWLQMCQTRNTKLRVQRAPVSKLLSTKEPNENCEPEFLFPQLKHTGIKLSTEIKNTYIMSFSYLLLIRFSFLRSKLASKHFLTQQPLPTNPNGHTEKGTKNSQSLSPWSLKFCVLRASQKWSSTFLNHS